MRKLVLIVTLAVATFTWAQSPFVGTWKLNPAKGHYTDTTFSYTETSPGHFLLKSGSFSYQFNMDGKDYPTMMSNTTNSWQPTGPNRWHQTQKLDGKITGETDTVISNDGKTMTDTGASKAEDGTQSQSKMTYQRVSGGPGLAGTWKTANAKFDGDFILVISEPSSDSMKLEDKHNKIVSTGPTDGKTPWTITSQHPDAMSHFSYTNLRTSPRSVTYTNLLDGKVIGKGEMKISANGQTLTDTYWDVKEPEQRTVDVYEKQ